MFESNSASVSGDALSSKALRVLHVGPGWGQRGGIASVLEELQSQQGRFQEDGVSFSFFETHGFQRAKDCAAFVFADVPRFAISLLRGVDIVHFHVSVRGSFYRKAMLCVLARVARKKTVFHLHAGNFRQFEASAGSMSRRFVSWFVKGSDAVVAVSSTTGRELQSLGAESRRLHVIANTAVDAEKAVGKPVMSAKREASVPYIAFAGRLAEAKGIDDLLQAVSLLKQQACRVELRLAGDGNVLHWEERARIYGIDDRVVFMGWLGGNEKIAFYRSARVFCMPSHYESFGIATLEAMFAGVPVVGTRVGGFLDLVESGVTGYLVRPTAPVALAACLRRLIDDPVLARAVGDAGLARAQANFSAEAVVCRYIQCYRAVMDGQEVSRV
ncbi:glycosyltransferase family 4 protein [Paraburkholderia sp.]|uniref:glycosyltransferase family 4 protein n=1 Tax=Paraburkholderia sp. TaxID=1926495 RepID=UPI00238A26A9|nr:glycosyltransferase family 4 protein [Paraburkholderia sp.]MDE1179736.1 glycosyltransferase family 4 protein [Paraburkholderia sp.]